MNEKIYGEWSRKRGGGSAEDQQLQELWHNLAAHPGEPNSGLTQRKNEIIELWQLFRRQNPRLIVEVGVAQGGTFASWCQLADKYAVLIGIDKCVDDCRPRPGDAISPRIYRGPLRKTLQGGGMHSLAKKGQRVIALNGWSTEEHVLSGLKQILNDEGQKIDFLFHDASHSAEMFKEDFELYWPMIADGGVFASHDINWSADPKCNKRNEWDRIKRTATYSACYEYLPHMSVSEMGIGVFIK